MMKREGHVVGIYLPGDGASVPSAQSELNVAADASDCENIVVADFHLMGLVSQILELGLEPSEMITGLAVSGLGTLLGVDDGTRIHTKRGVEMVVRGRVIPGPNLNEYAATFSREYDFWSELGFRSISQAGLSADIVAPGVIMPGDTVWMERKPPAPFYSFPSVPEDSRPIPLVPLPV